VVGTLDGMDSGLKDAEELLALAVEEDDAETLAEVCDDVDGFEEKVVGLEFRRMFSGQMDANNAFLDIQSGSGGTEAQDGRKFYCACFYGGVSGKGLKLN